MQIVLIYKPGGNGQVAFAASRQAPERRYAINNGVLTLAGYADDLLHADAEELLRSDAYRIPTPLEQEQMAQIAQASEQVQESSVQSGTGQGESADTGEQTTSPDGTEPPALDNIPKQKAKASGG